MENYTTRELSLGSECKGIRATRLIVHKENGLRTAPYKPVRLDVRTLRFSIITRVRVVNT
jgi:hypothetical protein